MKFPSRLLTKMQAAFSGIWTNPYRGKLPERVLVAIRRNDELSEILVRAIQLIVFTTWGLLYASAPTPNPDTVSLFPVIISLYLIITLAGIVYVCIRPLPDWAIYASIFVDMTLLTFLIGSFHIQYDQPASFSLKAPTMLTFFLLIGLRSLRFDARYVVAAGIVAALCWTSLVVYVIAIDPKDTMITRDYITYLTTNSVLIGAEATKVITILMFTAVLAISVRRAHNFLSQAVLEGSTAQELSRFLSTEVASQIRQSDGEITAGEGTRIEAAVMNIDIRGFTRMVADMEPGNAMRLLSDYQQFIVPIVNRHGGNIDKFMGDGILVTFSDTDNKPYVANAIRCSDEILASQTEWDGPSRSIQINLAVAAGPVLFGAVGHGDRLEFTVIGSTVNFSAKLEKHNKQLGTKALSDSRTYGLALSQGYVSAHKRKSIDTVIEGSEKSQSVVVLA